MDKDLKNRFLSKTIEDLLNDNFAPLPCILCEIERTHITELVRKFCLYSEKMIPFTSKNFQLFVEERLEVHKDVIDYGQLYILVDVN